MNDGFNLKNWCKSQNAEVYIFYLLYVTNKLQNNYYTSTLNHFKSNVS